MKDGFNSAMATFVTQTQTTFWKICQCLRVLSQAEIRTIGLADIQYVEVKI